MLKAQTVVLTVLMVLLPVYANNTGRPYAIGESCDGQGYAMVLAMIHDTWHYGCGLTFMYNSVNVAIGLAIAIAG